MNSKHTFLYIRNSICCMQMCTYKYAHVTMFGTSTAYAYRYEYNKLLCKRIIRYVGMIW